MSKFSIPKEKLSEVREWFRTRCGVAMWKNLEIGVQRPEMITPATTKDGQSAEIAGKPHWAMGFAEYLSPEDIDVREETPVLLPPVWFEVCSRCKGTGVRSLHELAEIRDTTIDDVLALTRSNEWYWGDIDHDNMTFPCNCCSPRGSGHVVEQMRVSVRRHYWGSDITDTGKERARKMANRLGKYYGLSDVKWDWSFAGYGKAEIRFYVEHVVPFTMGEVQS